MNITIQGFLCDLNNYIKAERGNKFAGAKIKKAQTELVCWSAKGKKQIKDYPVKITFKWYNKDNRKDPDNICFAKKFILDGLVMAKVLKGDEYKYISGFEDLFFIDKDNPRVDINIKQYE